MAMRDKTAGTESGQCALTRLGRLCCENAVGLYEVRRSALRTLGRARGLVRSLRHVPSEDLQVLENLLASLADFRGDSCADGSQVCEDASVLSRAVATTFSAPTRRKIRECLGSWTSVRVGRGALVARDGSTRLRRRSVTVRTASAASMTVRELKSLLDGMTTLVDEIRKAEKGLDLAGFGLMPCDCARFGLKEQIRYHMLLGDVVRLGDLLTRRLG